MLLAAGQLSDSSGKWALLFWGLLCRVEKLLSLFVCPTQESTKWTCWKLIKNSHIYSTVYHPLSLSSPGSPLAHHPTPLGTEVMAVCDKRAHSFINVHFFHHPAFWKHLNLHEYFISGGGNVSLISTNHLCLQHGPYYNQTLQPLSANFSQNANPSNTSQRGFCTAPILQSLIMLREPPLTLPSSGTSMPLLIQNGEKTYSISLKCVLILLLHIKLNFSFACLFCFLHLQFSPVRGWRGWAAAWTAPSGCWHLSSCPVCSPPAPLWHWDKTLVSLPATVSTQARKKCHENLLNVK